MNYLLLDLKAQLSDMNLDLTFWLLSVAGRSGNNIGIVF